MIIISDQISSPTNMLDGLIVTLGLDSSKIKTRLSKLVNKSNKKHVLKNLLKKRVDGSL